MDYDSPGLSLCYYTQLYANDDIIITLNSENLFLKIVAVGFRGRKKSHTTPPQAIIIAFCPALSARETLGEHVWAKG